MNDEKNDFRATNRNLTKLECQVEEAKYVLLLANHFTPLHHLFVLVRPAEQAERDGDLLCALAGLTSLHDLRRVCWTAHQNSDAGSSAIVSMLVA